MKRVLFVKVKCCRQSIIRRWRTSSSAVKAEFIQITLALMVLVFGGAAEELLPKVAGVGFPVLMSATVFFAMRRSSLPMVLFAIAAGGMEDALCSLPLMTSVSFFLALAALARWSSFPHGALVMAYPLYQLWLWIWTGGANGGLYGRALVALPFGLATALATWAVLSWAERRAAVDEA